MFTKRGQLTIFIIIGVVIVLGVLVYFVSQSNSVTGEVINDERVGVVQENILDCFEQVYGNSLEFIGLQGGYVNFSDSFDDGYIVPYHYNQGVLQSPSLERVEQEIGMYLDEGIKTCVDFESEIVSSESLGVTITRKDLLDAEVGDLSFSYTNMENKVVIHEDEVSFVTDLDLVVETQDGRRQIIQFKEYPVTIPSHLYLMHEIGSYITSHLQQQDESLCMTCLDEMIPNGVLTVDFLDFLDEDIDRVLITSLDESSPLFYQFLIKYSPVNDAYEIVF